MPGRYRARRGSHCLLPRSSGDCPIGACRAGPRATQNDAARGHGTERGTGVLCKQPSRPARRTHLSREDRSPPKRYKLSPEPCGPVRRVRSCAPPTDPGRSGRSRHVVEEDVLWVALIESVENAAQHPVLPSQECLHRIVRIVRRRENSRGPSVRQRPSHQRSPHTFATLRGLDEEQLNEVTAVEVSLPPSDEPRDRVTAHRNQTGRATNQPLDFGGAQRATRIDPHDVRHIVDSRLADLVHHTGMGSLLLRVSTDMPLAHRSVTNCPPSQRPAEQAVTPFLGHSRPWAGVNSGEAHRFWWLFL